jgi:cytochrome c
LKTITTRLLGVTLLVLLTVPALAGTRDDCVTKCKEASDFILTKGIAAAIKEIGNKDGRFVWNDGVSYIFLMNMDAKMLAHPYKPELTKAESLRDTKDVSGKFLFQEMVKKASNGKGWTKYMWPVPGKDVNKPKHTFIYRVPNTDYFVGAGFYVMSPGVYY